jgi:hypothetical protein
MGVEIPVAADKMEAAFKDTAKKGEAGFKQLQGTTDTATKETSDGIKDVGTSVDTLTVKLDQSKEAFKSWALMAVEAAKYVKTSIDTVSFGSSPGGIKEIPIQLAKANEAAKEFENIFTNSMGQATAAIPTSGPMVSAMPMAMGAPVVTTAGVPPGVPSAVGTVPEAIEAAVPEGAITLNFNVTTINADGLKQAVERDIVPILIDTVRGNRRQSRSDMRSALGILR